MNKLIQETKVNGFKNIRLIIVQVAGRWSRDLKTEQEVWELDEFKALPARR